MKSLETILKEEIKAKKLACNEARKNKDNYNLDRLAIEHDALQVVLEKWEQY
jgi:hypothetical protein